jgi:hypothetical protein
VRTKARATEGLMQEQRCRESADELKQNGTEYPDNRIPQRQPEHGVLSETDVVAESDKVIFLRLVQDVVVQAHFDRHADWHDDRGKHTHGGRHQV